MNAGLGTIVSVQTLAQEIEAENLCVLDCRFNLADVEAGRRAWREQHLPGARYAHLEEDLSGPIRPGETGRHPLPSRMQFARRAGALGIGPETHVVCYDDAGGSVAARAWWMLRWIGHGNVAVLDGGWSAWTQAGLAVTSEQTPPDVREAYPLQAQLTKTLDADDLPDAAILLLDARAAVRFRGDEEPIDPVAGHIPGAVSAPFSDNLSAGRFKSPAELRQHYGDLGVAQHNTACYCGSGVTAAHNILACAIAGLPEPALYAGSWSEWITSPDRQISSGD